MSAQWTDARLALLKSRWASGCSAAVIARELDCGLSRSAVLGKIHRLVHAGDAAPRITRIGASPRGWTARKIRLAKPTPLEQLPARDADGNLLTIQAIASRQCRWPYGDGAGLYFCGHETPIGTSWCPYHETRVWQPGAAAKKRADAITKETELARAA